MSQIGTNVKGSAGSPDLAGRFAVARADRHHVVLEGLHAVKHALRFGAPVSDLATSDAAAVLELADELAPDVVATIEPAMAVVDAAVFAELAGRRVDPPLLGIAPTRRAPATALSGPAEGHAVVLEDPRHPGNAGAVVRVAAAAGADAVFSSGSLDPWSAAVLRAAAGLHYAIVVGRLDDAGGSLVTARQVVALDPGGAPLVPGEVDADAVLLFGGERHGLSAESRHRADLVRSLPMRAGVSSLNLATSVAATLYSIRAR